MESGEEALRSRYDYVVDQEIHSMVLCKICKQIAHDPVNFKCKYTLIYCKSCATHGYNSTACIACKNACGSTIMESPMCNELLAELQVHCFNKRAGCSWQGEQHKAANHLEYECEYNKCTRQAKGCSWRGKKTEVDAHTREICEYAIVSCRHGCNNDSIQRNEMSKHDDECEVVKAKIREEAEQKEEERRKAQEATGQKVVTAAKPRPEEIVRLNVGGESFATSKHSLTHERSSPYFRRLIESEKNWEEEKGHFLDRDPKTFGLMLRYLRYGSVLPQYLKREELHLLLIEGMHWCIKSLVEEIMRTLEHKNAPSVEISYLRAKGRNYNGWRFRKVRFYSCTFDKSSFDDGEMRGVVFTECSFAKCSAKNTEFGSSEFIECEFSGANLENASLTKARVDRVRFDNAMTRGCRCPANTPSSNFNGKDQSGGIEVTNDYTLPSESDFSGSRTRKAKKTERKFEESEISIFQEDSSDAILQSTDDSQEKPSESKLKRSKFVSAMLPNDVKNMNFADCYLVGYDFSGMDLTGARFHNAVMTGSKFNSECKVKEAQLSVHLTGSVFSECDLSGHRFTNSQLAGADFSTSILSNVTFSNCELKGAKFPQDMSDSKFIECDLTGCDLSERDWSRAEFQAAVVAGSNFKNSNLSACKLPENLSGCEFSGCNLSRCDLSKCNLKGGNLAKSRLTGTALPTKLQGANMSECDLSERDLSRCNLVGASLSKSKLTGSNLPRNLTNSNLSDCDLSQHNLSQSDLSGANLSKSKLTGATLPKDLTRCNFSECDLSQLDLTQCNFFLSTLSGANLSKCKLTETLLPHNLTKCNFSGCDLSQQDLFKSNLSGANLSEAQLPVDLTRCELSGSNLSGCNLSERDLSQQDLSTCNLSGAKLNKSKLKGTRLPQDLTNYNLSECNLSQCDLSQSNLNGADLSKSKLKGAQLPRNLANCNLSGCYMSQSILIGANLSKLAGAQLPLDLTNSDLSECDLSECDLSACKVTGVTFSRALLSDTKLPSQLTQCKFLSCDVSGRTFSNNNLSGADFTGANLSGANLSGANLSGADLTGANLTKADMRGITQWIGVKMENATLSNTKCDVFKDSQLLTGTEQLQLREWLKSSSNNNDSNSNSSNNGQSGRWELVYSTSDHGDAASTFHQRCDNKGATFVVIQSGSNVFGGYASSSWTSSSGYVNAPGSFLFSLRNPHGFAPTLFKLTNPSKAMYCNSSYGPRFGGNDLIVYNGSTSNTSSSCNIPHSYEDTRGKGNASFTGAKNFQVTKMEVFSVAQQQ